MISFERRWIVSARSFLKGGTEKKKRKERNKIKGEEKKKVVDSMNNQAQGWFTIPGWFHRSSRGQ